MTATPTPPDDLAGLTPQQQANFVAMMGQRKRLIPNADGTIPVKQEATDADHL